ncbi:hypothetical protein SAMN04488577_3203 [Bacillus sp. cl95]|uniref:hypothetical protein n=1 Tax=Bacillus sp. UNCCL13 TaxID=1502772 RepID=UPI0008EC4499|nr:hypothetical protein [Bacillus sp. UNCCL13]SFB04580.1 hypothetical protein SAMN02799634_104312 [Bacillus sp. UNCCL13]SFQ88480.1 hypothetical protein SAMN04488577_3203 [Bacillus sp. cl95]
MDDQSSKVAAKTTTFAEIVKNAYEKGSSENEMTVIKLIEDLKLDLQDILLEG